ncbi:membrane dipeptidase [Phytoactinopolyspora limicola]|uniref:membrane dipeptidase n=1 Tax=Phytoactinopolyspora limicola TaxID=2715536 RepID=UPI0014097C40
MDRTPPAHLVVDGHNDIAWELRVQASYDLDTLDLARHQPSLHTDIGKLRSGGVGAQFFSVFVPGTLPGSEAVTATLEQIDGVYQIINRYPDTFAFARTAADVRTAMADGRIAALLGAEGGHSIDHSLGALRMLRKLGVAYLTLTHNQNNTWADSATDVELHGGLNEFGRDVVREMNRIGMLVDLSHVAVTTMRDALAVSSAPVIFSHSSCRAICGHPRNVPDDILTQLPNNGGVVMITFVPSFVSQECADHGAAADAERIRLGLPPVTALAAAADEPTEPAHPTTSTRDAAAAEFARWQEANPAPQATLAQVADHIDHAREVAGARHIGLGGDYDGTADLPVGLEDVSTYPALLAELRSRHWSEADLADLTSGNILRVLSDAEAVADPGFGT